jgi:hypothetical protein
MRAGEAKAGFDSPALFSLDVKGMPAPFHHVELAIYADELAIIATSRKPVLLVTYLESFFSDLERLADRMEDHHKRLGEQHDARRKGQ